MTKLAAVSSRNYVALSVPLSDIPNNKFVMPIPSVCSPVFRPGARPSGSEDVGKLPEEFSSLELSPSSPPRQTGASHRQNELIRLANEQAARKVFNDMGVTGVAKSFNAGKLRSAAFTEGVKVELAKLMVDQDINAFLACVHNMEFQQEGRRFALAKLCAQKNQNLFLGIDEEEGEEFSTSKVSHFNLSEESKFALAMEAVRRDPELFSNDLVIARFDLQDSEHMLDLLQELANKKIDVYSELQVLTDKMNENGEEEKPSYMQFSNRAKVIPLLAPLFINYANSLSLPMPQASRDVEIYLGVFKGLFPCFGSVGAAGSLQHLIPHFSGLGAALLQKISEMNSSEENPRVRETSAQWGFMAALFLRIKKLPEEAMGEMLESVLAWRNPEGRKELTALLMRSGIEQDPQLFKDFIAKFETPQKRLFAAALWPIYQEAVLESASMERVIDMLQRKAFQSSNSKRDRVVNGLAQLRNCSYLHSTKIADLLNAALTEQQVSRDDKTSAMVDGSAQAASAASFVQAMRDLTFILMLNPTADKKTYAEIVGLKSQSDIRQLARKNERGLFNLGHTENDQEFVDDVLNFCQKEQRMPWALLAYAGSMRSLANNDSKMEEFFHLFTKFIKLGLLPKDKAAYRDMRYGKTSTHMEKLHAKAKKELAIWKDSLEPIDLGNGLTLHDSDEPWDLFIASTEIPSCQRVDGSAEVTKCLLNNCMDGKIRTMVVRNELGKIVAYRDFVLLWDKKRNKPVIHMNRLYQDPGVSPEITQRIAQRIRDKAVLMGASLVCGDDEVPGMEYRGKYENPIDSLGAATPFEYPDQHKVKQNADSTYAVRDTQILYSP